MTTSATTYGKTQLIEDLGKSVMGVSREQLGSVVDHATRIIQERVQLGERVTIPGFGTWQASDRAEPLGTHPQTHERLIVPAQRGVRFTPGTTFKQAVSRRTEQGQYARERGG